MYTDLKEMWEDCGTYWYYVCADNTVLQSPGGSKKY